MATLVLLTESYPLGGMSEPGFIGPEIEDLAREFDRVIIAPVLDKGPQPPLPANVEVDRSLLRRPGLREKALTLLRPETWRRLNDDGRYIHTTRRAVAALAFTTYVFHYRRKLRELIASHRLDLADTLFYSFWFEYHPSALAGIEGTKTVVRVHGHDIYDFWSDFLSHSWREFALARLLRCYPVAEHGAAYMRADYPGHAAKIQVRRLGNRPPLGLNPEADDDEFVMMSIARLAPEKRIPLLCRCMCHWARLHPGRRFRWIHAGDGPMMEELRAEAALAPSNLAIELKGVLPNEEVHRILATRHIDATALLSRFEGLGIAACESLAYGIPVVAAASGGLPEVVTDQVGVLLSPDPTPEEFAARLDEALPRLPLMREAATRRWAENFDARPLRRAFAREIRKLLP